jgi:TatD DNase family protein
MFYPDIHTHFRTANPYSILNSFSSINIPHSRGIHPWHIDENYKLNLHELETDLQHPFCVALGEIGLDKLCSSDFELQRKAFIQQIELSEEFKLPIIIHCVKASNELFQLKKEIKPSQKWIWHGFNKIHLLQQALDIEIIPSVGQAIMHHQLLQQEVSKLNPNQFLLETDTSILSIEAIYKTVAMSRNYSLETLQKEQITNFKTIFTKWHIG